MKPGPKIGSLQKRRKYRRPSERAQSRRIISCSGASDGPGPDLQDGHSEILDDGLEKEDSAPPIRTMAGNEKRGGGQRNAKLNTYDLAFILHPSHDVAAPDQAEKQSPGPHGGPIGLFSQACTELGVSQAAITQIIRIFFDNMVAINLFHEPSFAEKLSNISLLSQLTALLAAITGYASRFCELKPNSLASDTVQSTETSDRQPSYFVDLAFTYINKSLMECDDEVPPLCVIQALIIATHCQLTHGVRGKAWRSLGLCVSLIYEANLHLLDSGAGVKTEDVHQWQEDEEKRRAFWAVWEMDVFASTIRRTPTAINWTQIEVLLPVDNAHWFSGDPTSSCFMEYDPSQRWKALQDCGNQSPKAWYLIISSFMKEAQTVHDPQGVPKTVNRDYHHLSSNRRVSASEPTMEARLKLETLANAVRCFSLALPSHLHFRDQYLAFGAPVQRGMESQRQQHCSVYNIYAMTQLAHLMIYRYDAFRSQNWCSETNGRPHFGNSAGRGTNSPLDAECAALRQYYEAADRILRIVNRSCDEHVKYINPFMSSTIWLASAVQLVRKYFARTRYNRSLINSRFNLLYLTYKRCVQFWDIQTALQRNLELIEEHLDASHKKHASRLFPSSEETSKQGLEDTGMNSQSSLPPQGHHIEGTAMRAWGPTQASQYVPEVVSASLTSAASIDVGLDIPAQDHAQQHSAATGSMATLDYIPLSQGDRIRAPGDYMVPTDYDFFDPQYLGDFQLDQPCDWPTFDISGGLQVLFSG
ncbi:hypothetical protein ASPBRDRAFT_49083 [Aspergillus brasiliensis CBS 101740]|uniref:Xylanolytic transcriptional activator regulatory domain-containing protein n=1 Tax=Aspergillus brasiliensis (strain CBS 101740 / IMI 381727 / IBT 21946) TaxID=767769 RepID=A0A1L9U4G4_ASPBC|nr:hypothetical protein ASPBRDRAFT_49083 [Aspergillus brasiliensis CBS 101740]